MVDINKIPKVDNVPVEKLIVYSPEQCPFRTGAFNRHGDEQEVCGYLKSLHLMESIPFTFQGHTITSIEKEQDADCCCTDEVWITGCPLLSTSFIIEKN